MLTVNDLSLIMQHAYFKELHRWQHNSSSTYTSIRKRNNKITVEFSCYTLNCFERFHIAKIEMDEDGAIRRVKWDKENTYEVIS